MEEQKIRIYPVCARPVGYAPPVTVHVSLHGKSLCKIGHARLGCTNNMYQLSWGHKWKRQRSSPSVSKCPLISKLWGESWWTFTGSRKKPHEKNA